ncbi:aminocarboxymuconate-semialdehyde decarboxylase [Neobacillus niacini]|jgi:aminocarboxymuconate-semialdehyde decarboxylase|uniref:amidohydrolase family protein n=1 Tax=Neobacillus niacini TaxID=86668 RepID=UPI0027896E5D|nr:amidohydrolase family protein [Neobacillus niacini]MDQ1003270.1 aminocarboxymuconate-semialdehyde decarboxylase [Neobacillus niacini]
MEMRVDFHTHIIPENFPDFSTKYQNDKWPILQPTCSCGANIMVAGKVFREVTNQVWSPEKRIIDMEKENVDLQVLSPIPVTFSYWAPIEEAEIMARFQNDFIAETVAQHPTKFIGLGTVPVQNVESAIRELDHCVHKLGLKGIEIGTNINGKNLDDESLTDFFAMCEKWNVPIFVHPWETLGSDRFTKHNLMYTVGMPSETALAASSLILGGVIDKFPGLKICFSHGGGSLPYILPRLDHGWNVWPHLQLTEQPPSFYAKKFFYDSIVNDPVNIKFLVEKFGAEQVIMGSDYPFLLRETPPGKIIDDTLSLTADQKRAMLGENALRFLNIPVNQLI